MILHGVPYSAFIIVIGTLPQNLGEGKYQLVLKKSAKRYENYK
ncbi:hypothetical protein PPHE_a3153 [Pseudoalteromonas phenolica O-BC30]|nr:hypothetical protein [Pseudoalteromonas phenolica O-BC30]